jgi:hypothetical protein
MFTLFSVQTDGCGNLIAVDEDGNELARRMLLNEEDGVTKADFTLLAQEVYNVLEDGLS